MKITRRQLQEVILRELKSWEKKLVKLKAGKATKDYSAEENKYMAERLISALDDPNLKVISTQMLQRIYADEPKGVFKTVFSELDKLASGYKNKKYTRKKVPEYKPKTFPPHERDPADPVHKTIEGNIVNIFTKHKQALVDELKKGS